MVQADWMRVEAPPRKEAAAVVLRPTAKSAHLSISESLYEQLGKPTSCGLYVRTEQRQIGLNFDEDAYDIQQAKAGHAIVKKGKNAYETLDNISGGSKPFEILDSWLIIEVGDESPDSL